MNRNYVHLLLLARHAAEGNVPIHKCMERMIAGQTDIQTGVEFGAVLPDKDFTSIDLLSGKPLDSETLTGRISAICCGTACFFVCHVLIP